MAELPLFSDVGSVSDAVKAVILTAIDHFEEQRKAALKAEKPLRGAVEKVVARVKREFPEAEFQLIMSHDDNWQLNVYSRADSKQFWDLVQPVLTEHVRLQLTIVPLDKNLARS